MIGSKILTYEEAVFGGEHGAELKRTGHWIVAYVDPVMAWPVRVQAVEYRNTKFWIIPITSDAYPAVAIQGTSNKDNNEYEKIMRFLSVLSWVEDKGVSVESLGGGSRLFSMSKGRELGVIICERLWLQYLPQVSEKRSMLALALMREGRALTHPAYSFLSFWRVLEVAIGKAKIKKWVAAALPRLRHNRAQATLKEISAGGVKDIADHLYKSGRCAIAHAAEDPIVDPDQPADTRRLYMERPLVEALAEMAIEESLGLKTSATVFREHLYELSGLKALLGEDVIRLILENKQPQEKTVIEMPTVDVRLIGRQFETLKALEPVSLSWSDGVAELAFSRSDGKATVKFVLNFAEERLEFDIHNGFYGPKDDGSPEYMDIKADIEEFAKFYYGNGELEIINSETGEQIARKDAFIPTNVMVNFKKMDADVQRSRKEAARRRCLADAT